MTQYERSITISRPAQEVFEYVGDVQRLPEYFPQITSVEQLDDDKIRTTAHVEAPGQPPQDYVGEAWFRVREAGQSLEWGSEGPNNYQGELDVEPAGDDSCTLTVRITSDREDAASSIEDGLGKAVEGIAATLENAS